mmetsp:Transcript_132236/g.257676  ORF Transcript_132236/g.257676 Transcript_132236/m.257676 type:complete len:97 (-) Transcript_132236:338-628(-)
MNGITLNMRKILNNLSGCTVVSLETESYWRKEEVILLYRDTATKTASKLFQPLLGPTKKYHRWTDNLMASSMQYKIVKIMLVICSCSFGESKCSNW